MKIKFNWGTGIFIFIVLFLMACAVFIIFAARQDVNLVHKDYYEKGTDYSAQIRINQRSAAFKDDFEVINLDKFLVVSIEESLSSKIDSGGITLFRPSDRRKDVSMLLEKQTSKITFQKEDLLTGRYILKFHWYFEGLKYEVDQPINIQ